MTLSGLNLRPELGLKETVGCIRRKSAAPEAYPVVGLGQARTNRSYGQSRGRVPPFGWATAQDVHAGRKAAIAKPKEGEGNSRSLRG